VAAFDRVASGAPDLAQLRSIETRAQQKAVSKRARTMIQDIETAEARAALPRKTVVAVKRRCATRSNSCRHPTPSGAARNCRGDRRVARARAGRAGVRRSVRAGRP
jgi:hypothetical protein